MLIGQRAQKDAGDDAEDGDVGGDADGEREDGDGGEAGRLAQEAQRVARFGEEVRIIRS